MKRHVSDLFFLQRLHANRTIAAIALSLCPVAITSPAFAITTTWTGSSAGGDFNSSANWSDGVPGATSATDLGIFNSTTNVDGTVTFSADASHGQTFVQNTAETISFDVGPYMWTMSSFALVGAAGATDAPTMRVIGGKVQSDRILLGGEMTNTRPSIELTGSTTHWHTTLSAGPQVGLGAASSSILVHIGAKLSGAGQAIVGLTGAKNGSLTVDGVGSSLDFGNYIAAFHTGNAGTMVNATNNQVEVLKGATAKAANIFMPITALASENLIRVSGAGSTLNLVGTSAADDGRESRVGWAFTHGGSLSIDVSSYVNGSGLLMDLKLVGWSSEVGSSTSIAVSFVGGLSLSYEFRSDGFYLTNVAVVPEPASLAPLALGSAFVGTTTRRSHVATL